jgi:hypothetical protein
MRCQPEGVVEPLGEHSFGFQRLAVKECAVSVGFSTCHLITHPLSAWLKCIVIRGYMTKAGQHKKRTAPPFDFGFGQMLNADDDVIYFQYDPSTPLRFSAPA